MSNWAEEIKRRNRIFARYRELNDEGFEDKAAAETIAAEEGTDARKIGRLINNMISEMDDSIGTEVEAGGVKPTQKPAAKVEKTKSRERPHKPPRVAGDNPAG